MNVALGPSVERPPNRRRRRWKAGRPFWQMTTSPSRTASWPLRPAGSSASSGNQSVAFDPGRLRRLRVPPDTVATMRNPSHLTSAAQPSPEGTLPLLASIGARAGGRTPGSLSLTDVAG
jgi:hypothetical protein